MYVQKHDGNCKKIVMQTAPCWKRVFVTSLWQRNSQVKKECEVYEIIHSWTAVEDESEEWSSQ